MQAISAVFLDILSLEWLLIVAEKRVQRLLKVIGYYPIVSRMFRDASTNWSKIANFYTPHPFMAIVENDRAGISQRHEFEENCRLQVNSLKQKTVTSTWNLTSMLLRGSSSISFSSDCL